MTVEVVYMERQELQRESWQDTSMILEPTLVNEFFTRRISAFLRKLIAEFQMIRGRAIPMHRAYSLASPTFTREECYDVLKALRDKKILDFSMPHGITINNAYFLRIINGDKTEKLGVSNTKMQNSARDNNTP